MIVRLPARGGHAGTSRMFMAHLHTVALCRKAKPRIDLKGRPRRLVNDNLESALCADNRSGVAVLMHLVRWLAESKASHPPIFIARRSNRLRQRRKMPPERPSARSRSTNPMPFHRTHLLCEPRLKLESFYSAVAESFLNIMLTLQRSLK